MNLLNILLESVAGAVCGIIAANLYSMYIFRKAEDEFDIACCDAQEEDSTIEWNQIKNKYQ